MSIPIRFYSFEKKKNSTKIPQASEGTQLNCTLKENCGVVNPTIQVKLDADDYPAFNYMFIDEFTRYYFIDEWTYIGGLWECSASVDVLASYKFDIESSYQYVLRCADEDYYDGSIMDSYFPTKGFATTLENAMASSPYSNTGTLILGIIGNGKAHRRDSADISTATFGSVQYFAFTASQVTALTQYLFGDTYMSELIGDQITEDWIRVNYNPFQYIVSAIWFPFDYSTSGALVSSIPFGWLQLPVGGYSISNGFDTGDDTLAISHHPQATARGSYLNLEPYSRYALEYMPFGTIPLDSTQVGNSASIKCRVTCDLSTGAGTLKVKTASDKLIGVYHAQVGVPVQLSQMAVNPFGAFTSLAEGFAGFTAGVASGNVGGAISSLASGIIDTAKAQIPNMQTSGTNGSRLLYTAQFIPRTITKVMNIVDANDDHAGRPCCKELVLSTLSGYVQCADGELDIACTTSEYDMISSYLTGGFFIE